MASLRVIILGLFCLFACVNAIQSNSTACPTGVSECPKGCACLNKFCHNNTMWTAAKDACDKKHQCGNPNVTDQIPCSDCVEAAAAAAATTCWDGKTTEATESDKNSTVCVSTVWLRQRGLAHATLGAPMFSSVLCIPGTGKLPCGTPGHLLRDRDGALVSYEEVCRHRNDCVASAMLVSKLKHDFDWAVVEDDDGLQLTSLSAHPFSSPGSPSRIVAYVADNLNRLGLGQLCNIITQFSAAQTTLVRHALELTTRK